MRTKKEKKRLRFITIVTMVLLICLISSVSKDWITILENNKKANELSYKYDNLLSDEEKLKSEVTRLHDPNYVARYAKERYYYSSSGEVIIRMD